ncbi:hypothetical protein SEA_NICEHOUSE_198 [Rhodococcus phage NiceHouse]|nr:hypothetical protein SEA_NICEHOUSE_198 [Rhodococcus phage NiceHouse]
MSYPYNLKTKIVTGHFTDVLVGGEVRNREGYMYVTPFHREIRVDAEDLELDLYNLAPLRVKLVNGVFAVEVLVTDQPGISPAGWTYNFRPSWKEGRNINIPISLSDPDVIDITYYSESPSDPGVIVVKGEQGDPGEDGRGIVSTTADGNFVTITYTDGTTYTFEIPILDAGGNLMKYQYVHVQQSPASIWNIQHNLNRPISSVRINLGVPGSPEYNDLVLCAWEEIDANNIKVYLTEDELTQWAYASGRAIVA